MIQVEVHLFNSLTRYVAKYDRRKSPWDDRRKHCPPDGGSPWDDQRKPPWGEPLRLSLPAGTPPAEVARRLGIPEREIYVAWQNGRNIMTTFGGCFEDGVVLRDGDRLALSGPVPFSRAYGAPVC